MHIFDEIIARYMNPATYSIGHGASLAEVDEQMALRGVSALLVVDDETTPIGVITRTDLLRAGRPYDARSGERALRLSEQLAAADIFHHDPVCIGQDRSVRDAASMMHKRQVHRLLVVDADRPVGVLSVTDLLHAVAGSTLETPLSELASETIARIDAAHSIRHAVDRLGAAGVRGLVVMRDGHPAGCFTQREALAARQAPPGALVEDWMNPSVVCLADSTPLNLAARQAVLTHAPIIVALKDGKPSGVLTATDMIYALL